MREEEERGLKPEGPYQWPHGGPKPKPGDIPYPFYYPDGWLWLPKKVKAH